MEVFIKLFFDKIKENKIDVYNELSLQHELGIYLRNQIGDYKIEFERNVAHFGFDKTQFIKRETDISVYIHKFLHVAIELKYPRNGQVPEQMFSFVKDLKFLEQLTAEGFRKGYLIILTDEPLFYTGKNKGIYSYFRSKKTITGTFRKPTGKKDETIQLSNEYIASWEDLKSNLKYCVLEVTKPKRH